MAKLYAAMQQKISPACPFLRLHCATSIRFSPPETARNAETPKPTPICVPNWPPAQVKQAQYAIHSIATYLPAPVTSLLRPAVKAKRICAAVAGPAHLGLPASHAPRDTSNRLLLTL
jgi:hypothetical protein